MTTKGPIILLAAAVALLTVKQGKADDQKTPYHRVTCTQVRMVVASVGEKEAELIARRAGISEERISWARRCLK